MDKITAKQFQDITRENPRWADTLTEPIEVVGFCDMTGEPIERLSKFLIFKGSSFDDTHVFKNAACFAKCSNLENAAGTFDGFANFSESTITEIDPELNVTGSNPSGVAALFEKCQKLKVAQGTFNGSVVFDNSGIEALGTLNILTTDMANLALAVRDCLNLKTLTGTFPGKIRANRSGIRTVKNLEVPEEATIDVRGCKSLRYVPTDLLKNIFKLQTKPAIRKQLIEEARARAAIKPPNLEL